MSSVECLDGFYILSYCLRRISSPPAHALNYYAADLAKKILLNIYTYISFLYSFIENAGLLYRKTKGKH